MHKAEARGIIVDALKRQQRPAGEHRGYRGNADNDLRQPPGLTSDTAINTRKHL